MAEASRALVVLPIALILCSLTVPLHQPAQVNTPSAPIMPEPARASSWALVWHEDFEDRALFRHRWACPYNSTVKLNDTLAYEGTHSLEIDDDTSGQSYVRVILPPYLLNSSEVKVVFHIRVIGGDLDEHVLIRLGWINPVSGARAADLQIIMNLSYPRFRVKINPDALDWYEATEESISIQLSTKYWHEIEITGNTSGTYISRTWPGGSTWSGSLSVPVQDFNMIEIGADPDEVASATAHFLIDDIRIYVKPTSTPPVDPVSTADELIRLFMNSLLKRRTTYYYPYVRWNPSTSSWVVLFNTHILRYLVGAYWLTGNTTFLNLASTPETWPPTPNMGDIPALIALWCATGDGDALSKAKEQLDALWQERWNSTYKRFITNLPDEVWCLDTMRYVYAYLSYYQVTGDETYLQKAEKIFLGFWNLRSDANIVPTIAFVNGTPKTPYDFCNQYHMGTLLCVAIDLYKASGNATFLNIAKTIANTLIKYFWTEHGSWIYRVNLDGSPRFARFEMLWGIQEYGLCALYELTGNDTYMEYVKTSFEVRILKGVGFYNGLIMHGADYSG